MVKVGLHLPQWGPLATRNAVLAAARAIEDCGLDSAWVADHIVYPSKGGEHYPYADGPPWDPSEGFLEAFTTLSLAAGATTRIALGTSALVLPMREPLLTAKSVASLDVLSGGRTILALGGGWWREEFDALGASFDDRAGRYDESIQVMRALWTQGTVEHRGEFFEFDELSCEPRPLQPNGPPIWIAGSTAVARRRAARLGDGWHPLRVRPEQLAEGMAEIAELARAAGREPGDIGLSSVIGLRSDPDRDATRLIELGRVGVTHVVAAAPRESVSELCLAIEQLGSEVMPIVRRELDG